LSVGSLEGADDVWVGAVDAVLAVALLDPGAVGEAGSALRAPGTEVGCVLGVPDFMADSLETDWLVAAEVGLVTGWADEGVSVADGAVVPKLIAAMSAIG
jgi:hypothetical protein